MTSIPASFCFPWSNIFFCFSVPSSLFFWQPLLLFPISNISFMLSLICPHGSIIIFSPLVHLCYCETYEITTIWFLSIWFLPLDMHSLYFLYYLLQLFWCVFVSSIFIKAAKLPSYEQCHLPYFYGGFLACHHWLHCLTYFYYISLSSFLSPLPLSRYVFVRFRILKSFICIRRIIKLYIFFLWSQYKFDIPFLLRRFHHLREAMCEGNWI